MTNSKRVLGNAGEEGIVRRAIKAGLSALRQPGSGQFKDFPADLTLESGQLRVLGESKVRAATLSPKGKRSLTLDLDWLRKVVREAKEHGFHHAALFVRPKGTQGEHYVLLEEAIYFDLLRRGR